MIKHCTMVETQETMGTTATTAAIVYINIYLLCMYCVYWIAQSFSSACHGTDIYPDWNTATIEAREPSCMG